MKSLRKKYLESRRYHRKHGREKFSVGLRKLNRDDIDMMLPPGIARVLSDVKENSRNIWDYTARSNRVAVISDGSSVMSLGDIGPNAVMPILESSCLLLKKLADIDAVPIALDKVRGKDGRTYAFRVAECVKRFNPGFGAFVIENLSSPAIFETEALIRELSVPVIIDDIDGCAVAVLAAVLNSLKLTKRSIEATRFVISGAGGAGLSTASLLVSAGASQENIFLCDTRGVLYRGRAGGMNPYKESFAQRTMARKLDEIVDGADVFIGLSAGKVLRPRLIQRMNPKPIVLALAQPVPEIDAERALDEGAFIFASGSGQFNTVSSLLAYPGILRAVLDTRAEYISDYMRIAAAQAIARIAQRQVPQKFRRMLSKNYPYERKLGVFKSRRPLRQRYILPKLLDPRLVPAVADALAESAVRTNVAGLGLIRGYRKKLSARINSD